MKKLLAGLSALTLALLSNHANATNTLIVKGEIADTTCTIGVGYGDSVGESTTFSFSDISVNEFTSAEQAAGTEGIIFLLSNCSDQALKNTYIHFESGSTTDPSRTGVLLNTITTGSAMATGLAFRLVDPDTFNPIEIGSANQADGASIELTESPDGSGLYGKIIYGVQYYSIAETVTPGYINSHVTWVLGYK